MKGEWTADSVGPGWKDLVQPLIDRCKADGVEITQIKEKFGGLRFYVTGSHSCALADLIEGAERASFSICEDCGVPGRKCNPRGGWMRTLCPSCETRAKESR